MRKKLKKEIELMRGWRREMGGRKVIRKINRKET